MKRLVLLSLALATMACTVQTRPAQQYPEPPPPPPEGEHRVVEAPQQHEHTQHDHTRRPPPPSRPTEPPRPLPPPSSIPSGWDGRGHTKVAEVALDARRGSASIPLRTDLATQRIVFVVEGGDATITDATVTHGAKRSPVDARHSFRDNDRVKPFDVIGNRDVFRSVDVRFRGVSGAPTLQVWIANKAIPYEDAQWNTSGYTKISDGKFEGSGNQTLRLSSSNRDNAPRRLVLVVNQGIVDVSSITVYENENGTVGSKVDVPVNHQFRDGARTKNIDLRGVRFPIRGFDVAHKTVAGRPVIQVWADVPAASGPGPSTWDPTGWTKLTDTALDPKRDVAFINLKAQPQPPQRLTFVVENGDIEVTGIVVHFSKAAGDSKDVGVRQLFNNGNRAKGVDLAGNRKTIHHVEVRFKSTSGRPKVEVWAQ